MAPAREWVCKRHNSKLSTLLLEEKQYGSTPAPTRCTEEEPWRKRKLGHGRSKPKSIAFGRQPERPARQLTERCGPPQRPRQRRLLPNLSHSRSRLARGAPKASVCSNWRGAPPRSNSSSSMANEVPR